MKSFIMGKVVQPETSIVGGGYCKLGVLSGRTCNEYTVFANNKNSDGTYSPNPLYCKVADLDDGDTVCIIVNTVVTKNGTLGVYLIDCAVIKPELRLMVNDAFSDTKPQLKKASN